MNAHGGNTLTAILPFLIVVIAFAIRFRNIGRKRPLRLGALWVVPAILLLVAVSMFVALPPPPIGWFLLLIGLAVGSGLGWYRGRFIHIDRDEQGKLFKQASPWAFVIIAVLFAVRFGAREIFGSGSAGDPHSSPMLLTDTLLGFGIGLLTATRVELYVRARRILARG